ncbi:MAG TPA: hypothetical protein VGY58_00380, partial [Gemmataceae bacterium]|nr:hypothetical protein [Gemmataceae bacterium]
MHEEARGFESLAEWNMTQTGLGVFYMLVVLMNLGFVAYQGKVKKDMRTGLFGLVWGVIFLFQAIFYLIHQGWQLDAGLRRSTTSLMLAYGGQAGPILYSTLS